MRKLILGNDASMSLYLQNQEFLLPGIIGVAVSLNPLQKAS